MANSQTVKLVGPRQRHHAMQLIDQAPDGYVVKIAAPTRSLDQNACMWAMLGELRSKVPELQPFTLDDIKLRFLNALGAEMRFLPELEGQGMFPCGLKSSTLTVEQFSGLIELIQAFAAKRGVTLTEPDYRG